VLKFAFGGLEGDVERFGEVLTEVVGGSGLDGAEILGHGFDGVGVIGTGEFFAIGFDAIDDGDAHPLFRESFIDSEDGERFLFGFFVSGVGSVALLPEEFGGAEEEARSEFPAHNVGPLVDEEGEIAVALDPVFVAVPDDGFTGWSDDEFFFEFGFGIDDNAFAVRVVHEAVVGHDGALFGKAIDMFGFFAEEGFGDQKGEVGVDVSGGFEHAVEGLLHVFPDGVAVGFDHHATADDAVVSEVGFFDDIVVPLGVIFFPTCDS